MDNTIPGPYGREPSSRPPAPAVYKISIHLILAILIGLVLYRGLPVMVAGSLPPVKLVVYGFSTQEDVFNQRIFPAFEAKWEAKNRRDLKIESVFGPSGTIANQIVLGAPADVAIFSNAQHVRWLRTAKLIGPETQAKIIGYTPMIIVTRPGNPAKIKDFADLSRPGLNLIHAEPSRSGAGDWTVLAEYGSAYLPRNDEAAATKQLKQIWNNVQALGSSARAALTLFELGAGDALVTYEQEALLALDRGAQLEIVLPQSTIVAEHMVVVIDANVTRPEKRAAKDLVNFLLNEEGQNILAEYHLRQPESVAGSLSAISQPFTVEDLGGWSSCYQKLIEGIWKSQIAPQFASKPLPKLLNGQD